MRNIDLFDDYISGSLNDADKIKFEEKLQSDPEFKKEFELHYSFISVINENETQKELKNYLNEIHEEEFGKPNVLPLNRNNGFYIKVATVAAGVSIIVFLSGILIYRFGLDKGTDNQYEELVNKAVLQIQDVKRGIEKLNKKEVAPATMEASGFCISSKGYIITSLHSVKNADSVMVQNDKLDFVSAEKVWEEPQLDVAIFKLSSTEGINAMDLPISFRKESLDLGERVFAIGYPRETIVYSEGNISAETGLNGDTTKYQLSMLINPGNSGSPVLDEYGNLAGIISGRNNSAQGVSYAIKSKYIFDMIQNIPDEKLRNELKPDGKNTIRKNKRADQLKKLKPYVFSIKVYKSA
ncbi:MAG: S1C family serine protease [Bacteroidota bacterium]|jgi:serine protease Do